MHIKWFLGFHWTSKANKGNNNQMLRVFFGILIITVSLMDRCWASMYLLPANGDTVVGVVKYKIAGKVLLTQNEMVGDAPA